MSLATRCSSCGTVFRVVQDQLKVSEGWVRCGRCNEVFNALEGLFDLGRDAPEREPAIATTTGSPAASPAPAPSGTAPALSERRADADEGDGDSYEDLDRDHRDHRDHRDDRDDRDAEDDGGREASPSSGIFGIPASPIDGLLADPIDAHLFRKRGAEAERSSSVQVDARDRLEFSDARFDSDLFAENPSPLDTTLVDVLPSGVGDLPLESEGHQPDFLRRAERRARWHSPPMRAALGGLSLVAMLLLLGQVGHHFRDGLAAQWPSLRPLLSAWCRGAGCTLEAPRRIDDVSVESTALTRASGVDAFILSITLRDRGNVALTTPSIELNLTDSNGRLVARRALSPRDFGASGVLQPGIDTALQVMLNAGSYRVAGYTIEIFYP